MKKNEIQTKLDQHFNNRSRQMSNRQGTQRQQQKNQSKLLKLRSEYIKLKKEEQLIQININDITKCLKQITINGQSGIRRINLDSAQLQEPDYVVYYRDDEIVKEGEVEINLTDLILGNHGNVVWDMRQQRGICRYSDMQARMNKYNDFEAYRQREQKIRQERVEIELAAWTQYTYLNPRYVKDYSANMQKILKQMSTQNFSNI